MRTFSSTKTWLKWVCIVVAGVVVIIIPQKQIKLQQVSNIDSGVWKGKACYFRPGEANISIPSGNIDAQLLANLDIYNLDIIHEDVLKYGPQYICVRLPEYTETLAQIESMERASVFHDIFPNLIGSLAVDVQRADQQLPRSLLNGDKFYLQWQLANCGQEPASGTSGLDIGATGAWIYSKGHGSGLSSIAVAVLDSGIPKDGQTLSHVELDDPNRFILAWDPIWDRPSLCKDIVGHGAAVLGNITAEAYDGTDNEGVAGVTWSTVAYIYKIADASINVDEYDVYASVFLYCNSHMYNHDHSIINISAAWPYTLAPLENAVSYAHQRGVIICAGSGNDNNKVLWPAAYSDDYDNVIAVGSFDPDGYKAGWANYGPELTVSGGGGSGGAGGDEAPFATALGYKSVNYRFSAWEKNNYDSASGTSFATAQVTGLCELIWSINPELEYTEVIQLLIDGAEKVHSETYNYDENGHCNKLGYGIIQCDSSVELIPITGLDADVHIKELLARVYSFNKTHAPPQHYEVDLQWDPLYSDVVDKYKLYRATSSSGPWSVIGYLTETEYTDDTVYDDTTYFYNVHAVDSNLDAVHRPSQTITAIIPEYGGGGGVPDSEEALVQLPGELTLDQNYPNPFNPTTTVRYGIPKSTRVDLRIMNIRGQTVRTLVDEEKSAGWYTVTWDGKNESGQQVSSGIYLYLLETNEGSILKKMTLIR